MEGSGEFAQILRRFVVQSEGKSPGRPRGAGQATQHRWRLRTANAARNRPVRITTNVSYIFGQLTRNRVSSARCQPGRVVQDVSIELPDGVVPKNLPKPVHASAADFEFTREWSRHEQMIAAHSELRSSVRAHTCSPATIAALADAVEKIRDAVNPTIRFEQSSVKSD